MRLLEEFSKPTFFHKRVRCSSNDEYINTLREALLYVNEITKTTHGHSMWDVRLYWLVNAMALENQFAMEGDAGWQRN